MIRSFINPIETKAEPWTPTTNMTDVYVTKGVEPKEGGWVVYDAMSEQFCYISEVFFNKYYKLK